MMRTVHPSRLRPLLALAAIAATSACSAFTPAPTPPGAEPFTQVGRADSITLLVDNRNFSEVRLYVLRRGTARSLGVVGGKAQAEFEIDWDMSDPIRIRIHVLAGPTCTTEELLADPGDTLELQIDQNFMHSRQCR
ncbi:MAG: hypothetical protein R3253_00945 [Longimicrobiales bacterium]|nr:hypothetical protein [Longimicrobiales bacterium]